MSLLITRAMLLNSVGISPWTEGDQTSESILKEINPVYCLEGLMLKLQYFGHLMQRAESLEKTLMLGKIKGGRRRRCLRTRWLDGLTISMDINLRKLWETMKDSEVACCSPWGCKELDMA